MSPSRDRVVALDRRDEVARDELRALVDELVEGVLSVRPRLAPDHGARRVVYALPRSGHVPTNTFH